MKYSRQITYSKDLSRGISIIFTLKTRIPKTFPSSIISGNRTIYYSWQNSPEVVRIDWLIRQTFALSPFSIRGILRHWSPFPLPNENSSLSGRNDYRGGGPGPSNSRSSSKVACNPQGSRCKAEIGCTSAVLMR